MSECNPLIVENNSPLLNREIHLHISIHVGASLPYQVEKIVLFRMQFADQGRFEHLMLLQLLSTRVHDLKIVIQLCIRWNGDAQNDHPFEKIFGKVCCLQSLSLQHRWQMFGKQAKYVHDVLRSRVFRVSVVLKHRECLVGLLAVIVSQVGFFEPRGKAKALQ